MFGLESASASVQAATTVGLVFGEAMALYVGYGVLSSALGDTMRDALGGD
ncbi:MAG: hypothetical protein ABEJ68_10245 [Halobacteriaceae archaeon]